uniref:Candidate secreted effector n=1 Tax=Meloidogyne incognita TaxID=6306 RepID=A0A914LNB6_MELIC
MELNIIIILKIFTFAFILISSKADWSPWNAWSLCFEQNGIWAQTRTRTWLGDFNLNPGNNQQARACLPESGRSKFSFNVTQVVISFKMPFYLVIAEERRRVV